MKIIDILKKNKITLSLEAFPPKQDSAFSQVIEAVDTMCELSPDFMSVTYGAGGGTSENTVKIVSHVQNELGVTALAHLTCVSSSKEQVARVIGELRENNIENVLALRGDMPKDGAFPLKNQYKHASELVREIKA
ncbi:MAG: methylenetetrahydrofolate reductase, partial [Clostridia bacterium]